MASQLQFEKAQEKLSGRNLRSFDGATGAGRYDLVVKKEGSLGLAAKNVETFVTLSFLAMAPATATWSTMSRLRPQTD